MHRAFLLALLAAGCDVAGLGDPCTNTDECGNYVCEIEEGATQGFCAEPPTTPSGGSGATTTTGTEDTGP